MNKKIAFLTTGGTIISTSSDKGLVVSDDANGFINRLNDIIGKEVEVDFIDLYNIDSSDLNIENIEIIASKINQIKNEYDGFVVVHGTDTMTYTSSTLSYMLKGLRKPVVLTGSMIPIEYELTDAINNIINSFKASINSNLFGVYISFGDKLVMGNKAVKLNTTSFTTFDSPNFPLVGKFKNNDLIINEEISTQINNEILKTSVNIDIDEKLESKVSILKLYPGIDYCIFNFFIEKGIRGLVIEGFGDGNFPSDEEFKNQIENCINSGMIIILKSQCLYGITELKYAGGKALIDLGCINGYNLTTEASIAKLMWSIKKFYGHNNKIKDVLLNNINGDLLSI